MRVRVMAAAIVVFAVPAAVAAQSESAPPAETSAATAPLEASGDVDDQSTEISDAAAAREKKVCRTERMTGSLTRRSRICLTEREWARMAEGTRRGVNELSRDANQAQAQNPGAAIQGSAF